MRTPTVLLRIHFPYALVERLDQVASDLRRTLRRRVARAALVRAVVQIQLGAAAEDRQEVRDTLGSDPVKRGREKVRRPAARRSR